MKQTIVFGNKGFIGGNIQKGLKCQGYDRQECDLTKDKPFNVLNNQKRPVNIIFTSAITNKVANTKESYKMNVAMCKNMASYLFLGVNHFIYISTYDVYKDTNELITEESKLGPKTWYAKSKLKGEEIFKEACEKYGVKLTIIRLPGIYGPGETNPSVISIFLNDLLKGGFVEVRGWNTDERDYIYVNDLTKICKYAIKNKIEGTYNITSGKSLQMKELVVLMFGITKKGKSMSFECVGKHKNIRSNPNKFYNTFKGIELTPPNKGIKKMVTEWKKKRSY